LRDDGSKSINQCAKRSHYTFSLGMRIRGLFYIALAVFGPGRIIDLRFSIPSGRNMLVGFSGNWYKHAKLAQALSAGRITRKANGVQDATSRSAESIERARPKYSALSAAVVPLAN
jgi:hypothetical protein